MFNSTLSPDEECHLPAMPWWTSSPQQRSFTPVIRHNFRRIDELLSPVYPPSGVNTIGYPLNLLDQSDTPSPKTKNASTKPKRVRTVLTDDQRAGLEQFYVKNRYPDPSEMESLSQSLGLNEKVIRVWFQNQRSRGKTRSMFYSP